MDYQVLDEAGGQHFGYSEQFHDPVAEKVLDADVYKECYGDMDTYGQWLTEEAFLHRLADGLHDVHGDRNPVRRYDITFESTEPLDEEEFLDDIRDAVRWYNNPDGDLRADPRSRRAMQQMFAGGIGFWTSMMGGILQEPIAGQVNEAGDAVARYTGEALSIATTPEEVGAAMSATAVLSLAAVAHGKYKAYHLPSYELGANVRDKLDLTELDEPDNELDDGRDDTGGHTYQLTYRVRRPGDYAALAKDDAATLRKTPGFVKAVTVDQFAALGQYTAEGVERWTPKLKHGAHAFWQWVKNDELRRPRGAISL